MKFSFHVTCGHCSNKFLVHATGNQPPKSAQCPGCDASIWLIQPLGNLVGMAILRRAETEMENGDWTLTLVLTAMGVECQLAYLFMKWNRIDLMLNRNPTAADEEAWEKQWRDEARTIASRFDKVSELLTGQRLNPFLSQNSELLKEVHTLYQASKATSPKDFFVRELFHKRNRIVHFGKIDYQQSDAKACLTLGLTLWKILAAMDAHRLQKLEANHSIQVPGTASSKT
jgi:hypothetical protein